MSTIKVDAITTRTGSGEISLGTTGSQTINRTGDGELIGLQKAGSAIGSIGTANTDDLYIVNDDTGLMFSGGSDMIIPRGTAGAARDDAISFGAASHRFKDLYLSGGAFLGGTGAANKLEDYEEGTWTPTLVGFGGGNTQTYASQNGNYTKIGRQVVANFQVRLSAKGNISGSYLHIMGLPFPLTSSGPSGTGMIHYIWALGTARDNLAWEMGGGTTDRGWLTYMDGTTTSYVNTSDVGNTTGFMGALLYMTDA
tara:strand:+ start:1312 stop:2073 length:762 start_codon:yes stop_codon:yes gene_type:complete